MCTPGYNLYRFDGTRCYQTYKKTRSLKLDKIREYGIGENKRNNKKPENTL